MEIRIKILQEDNVTSELTGTDAVITYYHMMFDRQEKKRKNNNGRMVLAYRIAS